MCRREHHVVIFREYLISTCLEPKFFSKQLLGVDAIWWNATCFHKKQVILLIFWSLTLCLDGWILGRMEKKRVENMREWMGRCLDERGRGREKWWAQPFSLWAHHNSISPKWGEKEEECAGQNCPSPSHGQLFVFFYFCLSVVYLFCFLFWFFFFLDKILHSRRWFFLFVFICSFFFKYPFSICLFYK